MGLLVEGYSPIGYVWGTIVPYGWYLVGLAILMYYYYEKLQEKYYLWKSKSLRCATKKEDPDCQEIERLFAARERMYQKYQKDAILAQELALKKEEENQERKRQESLKNQTVNNRQGGGEASGGSSKSKLLKEEYLPLMGGSSSRGYRPQKRSACGKGGCG